jgi:predicted phage-related endonuclease
LNADDELSELYEIETVLNNIEESIKEKKARRDELKAIILDELSKSKIEKTEFEGMIVSVKKGCIRKTVDSSKLKLEMPDIYEKYLKETKVGDSLSIKLGG